MKKKIIPKLKILIDIAMLVLFLLLMSYHLLPDSIHEWIGLSLFILFVFHNIINYKWYKNLFKGKYKALRIIQTVINLSLIIAMICCVISSILVSGHVFSFIETNQVRLGRTMHLSSTVWAFILMSLHLGLYGSIMINKIKNKLRDKPILLMVIKYTLLVIVLILCVIGIYTFYKRQYWEELFALTEFKWFDYDKTLIVYILENMCIVMLFSSIAYYIKKLIIFLNKNKNISNNKTN